MSHPDMPLCRYRGALLLTTKLRKATKCAICGTLIPVGGEAWRVIQDSVMFGVVRSQRFCRQHFVGGEVAE